MEVKSVTNKILSFLTSAFSENGEPSSSRVLTFWLSISSLALLWFIVRHAMTLPDTQASIWVNGLPMIIGALAAFAASPYAIGKGSSSIKDIVDGFRKKDQ